MFTPFLSVWGPGSSKWPTSDYNPNPNLVDPTIDFETFSQRPLVISNQSMHGKYCTESEHKVLQGPSSYFFSLKNLNLGRSKIGLWSWTYFGPSGDVLRKSNLDLFWTRSPEGVLRTYKCPLGKYRPTLVSLLPLLTQIQRKTTVKAVCEVFKENYYD